MIFSNRRVVGEPRNDGSLEDARITRIRTEDPKKSSSAARLFNSRRQHQPRKWPLFQHKLKPEEMMATGGISMQSRGATATSTVPFRESRRRRQGDGKIERHGGLSNHAEKAKIGRNESCCAAVEKNKNCHMKSDSRTTVDAPPAGSPDMRPASQPPINEGS